MAWGQLTSDAAQPATYGSTTGFNDANSGLGINWAAGLKTLGEGSNENLDRNPGTIPTLAPPQIATPSSPVGRGQPRDIRELLNLLAQRQQMYQQAAHGPYVAGGLPQPQPQQQRPLGLLGV
jgi:hypothetical protein